MPIDRDSPAPPPPPGEDVSALLHRWGDGDPEAFDALVPIVYDRLREVARQLLRRTPGASLNTTGLVHEAWLKLSAADQVVLRDRSHFLAFASRVMRNVLIDQARARQAVRRGGMREQVSLDAATPWLPDDALDAVTDLDEALRRLEQLAPRQMQMLEQRYFGGLTLEETAEALKVSLATVKRELRSARAWLASQLGGDPAF